MTFSAVDVCRIARACMRGGASVSDVSAMAVAVCNLELPGVSCLYAWRCRGPVGVGVLVGLGCALTIATKIYSSFTCTRGRPRVVLVVASRRQTSTVNYVKGSTIVSPGLSTLTTRKALFVGNCSSYPDDAPTHTNLLAKLSP